MSNNGLMGKPNFWISITLIGLGVVFLLQNLGFYYFDDLWDYWPLLFVVMGFAKLIDSGFKDWISAGVLMLFGFFLLMLTLDYLDFADVWDLWPLILIYIGGRILLRNTNSSFGGKYVTSDSRVDAAAIFGGKEMRFTTDHFEGGSVTTLFGGTELHLENSRLAPGKIVLDVFVMFGGVEIFVPDAMRVVTKGFPIFGGFENKARSLPPDDPYESETVLIVKGFAAFGGIEIKNAG